MRGGERKRLPFEEKEADVTLTDHAEKPPLTETVQNFCNGQKNRSFKIIRTAPK